MKNVTALYETFEIAQTVSQELIDAGIPRGDISIIASDSSGHYAAKFQPATATAAATTDAVTGSQGAGFGAVVGAVVGAAALLIPGVGPVIAAGPLVAGLLGAGVGAAAGAVTGGITASLIHTGVDPQTADYYVEGVRRGGALVSVQVENARYDEVVGIINNFKPVNINTRAEEWRAGGWQGVDEQAVPGTTTQSQSTYTTTTTYSGGSYQGNRVTDANADAYVADFRNHYQTMYGVGGTSYTYDQYDPAYRYGYSLGSDVRYRDYDWQRLESDARRDWEARNATYPWDDFSDAVYFGWQKAKIAV